jgi:hypothetical protein
MGTGSFTGVQRPKRDVDHPPTSSVEVKEIVYLYLYSPSGPSWPVLGRPLPLPFMLFHHQRTANDLAYRTMKFPLIKCQMVNTNFNITERRTVVVLPVLSVPMVKLPFRILSFADRASQYSSCE